MKPWIGPLRRLPKRNWKHLHGYYLGASLTQCPQRPVTLDQSAQVLTSSRYPIGVETNIVGMLEHFSFEIGRHRHLSQRVTASWVWV